MWCSGLGHGRPTAPPARGRQAAGGAALLLPVSAPVPFSIHFSIITEYFLLFVFFSIPDPMARRLELCGSVSIIQGTCLIFLGPTS